MYASGRLTVNKIVLRGRWWSSISVRHNEDAQQKGTRSGANDCHTFGANLGYWFSLKRGTDVPPVNHAQDARARLNLDRWPGMVTRPSSPATRVFLEMKAQSPRLVSDPRSDKECPAVAG